MDDNLRDLRERTDASPWSEYRRLVLAELERLNGAVNSLRQDVQKTQTEIAILQDRIIDCKRALEQAMASYNEKKMSTSLLGESTIVRTIFYGLLALIAALATGQALNLGTFLQ